MIVFLLSVALLRLRWQQERLLSLSCGDASYLGQDGETPQLFSMKQPAIKEHERIMKTPDIPAALNLQEGEFPLSIVSFKLSPSLSPLPSPPKQFSHKKSITLYWHNGYCQAAEEVLYSHDLSDLPHSEEKKWQPLQNSTTFSHILREYAKPGCVNPTCLKHTALYSQGQEDFYQAPCFAPTSGSPADS